MAVENIIKFKTMNKKAEYTEEQTIAFKQARNEKSKNDSGSKFAGSVYNKGGTFTGSVRNLSTGPRRNNFQ